jgi:hypothetical protein
LVVLYSDRRLVVLYRDSRLVVLYSKSLNWQWFIAKLDL